jgi:hypothetical protein
MLNRNVDLAKILHVELELVILSEAKNLGYGRVLQETIARNAFGSLNMTTWLAYPVRLPLFVKSADAFTGLGRLAGFHVISQCKIDVFLH